MKSMTILIKPASSLCNASCEYCFYEDVSKQRAKKSLGLMQLNTAKQIVDRAVQSSFNHVTFAFQGGEPLLAGISFFREFVSYAENNKNSKHFDYALQTNGLLLEDEFCIFLKQNQFIVGISLDGFEENHDKYRKLRNENTFTLLMDKISLLRKYDIDFNVLSVLTKNLARNPEQLFVFYKENDFNFIQLIPCLAGFNKYPEDDLISLTPDLFASFYSKFFEMWLKNLKDGSYISENLIDNIINVALRQNTNRCGMFGSFGN